MHGLAPFIKDASLTAGAINVADFRAARLIEGHTANDFGGLPTSATRQCGRLCRLGTDLGVGGLLHL